MTTLPFTPEQSREIDDRIVEMMVTVMGEGEYARRCRVIAANRADEYLPIDDEDEAPLAVVGSAGWQPIATAPLDRVVLVYDPYRNLALDWSGTFVFARWIEAEKKWVDHNGSAVDATHWMELAAPNLQRLPPEGRCRPSWHDLEGGLRG